MCKEHLGHKLVHSGQVGLATAATAKRMVGEQPTAHTVHAGAPTSTEKKRALQPAPVDAPLNPFNEKATHDTIERNAGKTGLLSRLSEPPLATFCHAPREYAAQVRESVHAVADASFVWGIARERVQRPFLCELRWTQRTADALAFVATPLHSRLPGSIGTDKEDISFALHA